VKTLQQTLVCALLAALTSLAVYAILLLRATTATVAAIPRELQSSREALIGEADAARKDLTNQIAAARGDVLLRSERQIAGLRADVMTQAAATLSTADRRIGDSLARVDTALASVESLRQDIAPSLRNSAAITSQVNDALPLFLDCDHNPDCVFNRYVGASKGIERAAINFGQMSSDVRGTLPKMLLTWNQIGADVSGTAGNINKITKPHWYDRLMGYALNGAVLYRNLNPITSLTVTGAQILSGRQ
jgi:hypothetical protein